jgi:hypothetical protein
MTTLARNGVPCSVCGRPAEAHPTSVGDGGRRCLEYRIHGDTVLERILTLTRGTAYDYDIGTWEGICRRAGVPTRVPAVRWQVDINRMLAAQGLMPPALEET